MTATAMIARSRRRRQAPRKCAPRSGFGALTAPARPSTGLPCRQCSLIIHPRQIHQIEEELRAFGRVMTPAFPKRGPDAGTMDQVRPQTWRMAQTTRNARLVDLSSSNPIRWWPRADPEQKHDPGGTDDSQVER